MPFPDSYFYPVPPSDTPNYYIFPSEFTAGDYFQFFRVNDSTYPSSAGWTFLLALSGPGFQTTLASTTPSDFLMSAPPNVTAQWPPGRYVAQLYAVNTTLNPNQRITIFQVYLTVRSNVATATPDQDLRTHAQRMLDTIEAVLENKATDDILDSTIGDTTFRRLPHEKLTLLRREYLFEVRKERAQARAKAGLATGRRILDRFTAPS